MDNYQLHIYRLIIGDKSYIGSTWNIEKRMKTHACNIDGYHNILRRGKDNLTWKIRSQLYIHKYKWRDIEVEILYIEELDHKDEFYKTKMEQLYINEYDSKRNGLNTQHANKNYAV